jgi:hypothetical protein
MDWWFTAPFAQTDSAASLYCHYLPATSATCQQTQIYGGLPCPRKLPNITGTHPNITRTLPGITAKLQSTTMQATTKKRRTMFI